MKRSCIVAALMAGACVASLAADPECLQKYAVYTSDDGVYQLRFTDPETGTGMASNTFDILVKGSTEKFSGWVIWSDEVSRPVAVVTSNCPGGDITGEELDACKVWEGIVYSVWGDGEIDLLPPAEEKAAFSLLLPDFGRTLRQSKAWQSAQLSTVPWDAFRYQSCSKPS